VPSAYTEAVPGTRNGSFPQLLISLPTRWPISLPLSQPEEDFFPARTYFCSTERSHAGRQSLHADSPPWGSPLPAALPLASRRALFWKSRPLYLGRGTRPLSPAIRAISHTTIPRSTSANSDCVFPENSVWKLVS